MKSDTVLDLFLVTNDYSEKEKKNVSSDQGLAFPNKMELINEPVKKI